MKSKLVYGAVIITKGEHAGRLGYYDDDEGRCAVVYLGTPFQSPYILMPRSILRCVTSLEHERFKRDNPEFCRIAGID